MRLRVWIVIAVVVVMAGGVAALMVTSREPQWTTSSAEALDQLMRGVDMQLKLYTDDAHGYFAQAFKSDPDFVIAKVFFLDSGLAEKDSKSGVTATLREEIKKAPLDRLNDRERYLVQIARARYDKNVTEARRLASEFAEKHPSDPFAVNLQAQAAIARQDWDTAERLFNRLIEISPNRVVSYNELGYLAMARGRFAESERMFQTYRYVAPDQANPHDSLGELYVLLGRFAEAEREFEDALRIKPDFYPSFQKLLTIAEYQADWAKANAVLERAKKCATCPPSAVEPMPCQLAMAHQLVESGWNGLWKVVSGECSKYADGNLVVYYALLQTGNTAMAQQAEEEQRKRLQAAGGQTPPNPVNLAIVRHMEGMRVLVAGNAGQAVTLLRQADAGFSYRSLDLALPKIYNRLGLVRALAENGDSEAASVLLAEVREINPRLVEVFAPLLGVPALS